MADASVGLIQSVVTATTGSTTSTARAYFNGGGPIMGLYMNFDISRLSVATAGTLAQTYQPRVLCSADGTSYRVLAQGAPITATTSAITNRPVAVPFHAPSAEPYVKAELFGATATNSTTPICAFVCWLENAPASPIV